MILAQTFYEAQAKWNLRDKTTGIKQFIPQISNITEVIAHELFPLALYSPSGVSLLIYRAKMSFWRYNCMNSCPWDEIHYWMRWLWPQIFKRSGPSGIPVGKLRSKILWFYRADKGRYIFPHMYLQWNLWRQGKICGFKETMDLKDRTDILCDLQKAEIYVKLHLVLQYLKVI